ncbi:coiled-coil domain-containing protein 81 [Perognathus longimembris pacificus]|uniref:coiled-coil domain-containing protein 81 n=1 Tax=Perognathus longimembris pacificus TaxID=214514 RepID=UPI00201997B2|nr:coiled-coil domain-containing protein 81 [Perognathus longimembris pacificus]
MLDTIVPAVQEVGRQVLPTLPSLSQEDVSMIWGYVSEFVERQLALHKGVQIFGLGTFSFTRQDLEMGNKLLVLQRPVFILAEKLVQLHGLKQNKVYLPGDIPVVPLNFVMISLESPFTRDTVEGCVKETLLFLSRSIATKQNVEFTFKGIGVLAIKDSKVKMRFYKDFLCAVDGSGTLTKALSNRPGTMDSVLSSREALRRRPDSVLAFPRIEHKDKEGKAPMETIAEGEERHPRRSRLEDRPNQEEGIKEILSFKKLQDRQADSPTKVTSGSLLDKVERSGSSRRNVTPEKVLTPASLKNDSTKPKTSPVSACQDHPKSGQEMCYVCLQRAQRNFPLYYGEERRRKDTEDEQLIQQYQMLKDQEAFYQRQMKSLATREQNQKNAAYNLGVAEAIRNHKNEKPEFYKSFLFDKRPLSSEINALRQEEYSQTLLKQMEKRREKEIKQRQDREVMDRLEQDQLTEELAAQRAKYLKDKMEGTQRYKRALDAQIKNKPTRLPMFEPDSFEPIFGKEEGENLAEKRMREQKCMRHQLEAASRHKKKAILSQLLGQKEDLEMLQRTHRERLADRAAELERVNRINQCLQEDWERSAAMKKQRDLEERAFERASNKLFLLDQCQKYGRCVQCQRRTSNTGESNVWPKSKFIQGSRLLV